MAAHALVLAEKKAPLSMAKVQGCAGAIVMKGIIIPIKL